jgi:hypothetical protein
MIVERERVAEHILEHAGDQIWKLHLPRPAVVPDESRFLENPPGGVTTARRMPSGYLQSDWEFATDGRSKVHGR